MIQRIAEEAKLTDLDINAEERVSPKTTSTNEKGMNTLIFFSKPFVVFIRIAAEFANSRVHLFGRSWFSSLIRYICSCYFFWLF